MAIDTTVESLLPISEAASLFPGQPHVATLWRWISRGVRGVRLETISSGGRRFTSHEACHRFIAASTAASPLGGSGPVPSPATPHQRESAIARAEAEVAK